MIAEEQFKVQRMDVRVGGNVVSNSGGFWSVDMLKVLATGKAASTRTLLVTRLQIDRVAYPGLEDGDDLSTLYKLFNTLTHMHSSRRTLSSSSCTSSRISPAASCRLSS